MPRKSARSSSVLSIRVLDDIPGLRQNSFRSIPYTCHPCCRWASLLNPPFYLSTIPLSGLTNPDPTIGGVIAAYGTTPNGSPEGTTTRTSTGGGSSDSGLVPEPAGFLLLGTGLAGLAGMLRRKLDR
jgi:hypothetical protein